MELRGAEDPPQRNAVPAQIEPEVALRMDVSSEEDLDDLPETCKLVGPGSQQAMDLCRDSIEAAALVRSINSSSTPVIRMPVKDAGENGSRRNSLMYSRTPRSRSFGGKPSRL